MTEEIKNKEKTKEELETIAQSIILFYKNTKTTLIQMRDIFTKLGSPHIANTLEAAIGSIDIDLTQYDNEQEEKRKKEKEKDGQNK